MKKKVLAGMLCLVLGAAMFAGCGGRQVTVEPVEAVTVQAPEAEPAAAAEAGEVIAEEAPAAEPAAPAEEAPAPAEEMPAEETAAPAEAAPTEETAAPAEETAAPAEAVAAEAVPAAPAAEAAEAVQEATETLEAEAPEEAAPEGELAEGQMYSYLTGEPIDKEIGTQRPFAVMINNLEPAVPQSGIVNADILYEAFVESDITRLMAVFQDPGDLQKIGPVRSCRHYYLSMSDDNEALYTHFGWSIVAEALINEQGRTTINGMFYDGAMGFYRTDDRVAPHNAYVTADGLREIADSLGMSRTYPEGYEPNLHFNTTDTPLESGEVATYIQLPYPVNNPWFEYNEEEQLYDRFEYGAPHVDMESGEQLKFKNIIVQYADQSLIGDTPLLELGLIKDGDGSGLYFTDGKVIPIRWAKHSWDDRTQYYTTDGALLNMNPGKTMIQIIPESYGCTYSDGAA